MTLYSLALFLHIVGALGIFIALGLEWTSLWHLRRATTAEQGSTWLQLFPLLGRIYPFSWVAILLSGFYMTATAWGGAAWIGVAFATLFLLPLLGMVIGNRRMAAIGSAMSAEHGLLSPGLRQQLNDPLLWASIQTRIAIALGIVFLMSVKPGLGGSLLAIGLATVLGVASALPAWGGSQSQTAGTEQSGLRRSVTASEAREER